MINYIKILKIKIKYNIKYFNIAKDQKTKTKNCNIGGKTEQFAYFAEASQEVQ